MEEKKIASVIEEIEKKELFFHLSGPISTPCTMGHSIAVFHNMLNIGLSCNPANPSLSRVHKRIESQGSDICMPMLTIALFVRVKTTKMMANR